MSQTINEHLDAISKLADLSLLMSNRIVLLEEEIAIIKKEIYNRNELGSKFEIDGCKDNDARSYQ
jgi:hypothetical protein